MNTFHTFFLIVAVQNISLVSELNVAISTICVTTLNVIAAVRVNFLNYLMFFNHYPARMNSCVVDIPIDFFYLLSHKQQNDVCW